MKEKDILLDLGDYWVGAEKNCYTVFEVGLTHSTSDSAYEKTPDGLSIAKARCRYLQAKHIPERLI